MTRGDDDVRGDEWGIGGAGEPGGTPSGERAGRSGGGRARRRPYGDDEPREPRLRAVPGEDAGEDPDAAHTPHRRRSWARQKGSPGRAGQLGAHAAGEPYGDGDDGDGDDGEDAFAGPGFREPVLTAPDPAPAPAYEDVEPEHEAPRRGGGGLLLTALLAVAVVVLAVATTLSYLELRTLRRSEADGAAALTAARSYAADMLAYDHRHIEADLARARGHATARLDGYYRQLAATLIPQAKREQAVQQVTVAGAAVESATAERVRVLMLINRTTSKLPPGHRSRKSEVSQGRVRFVMVKRGDGAWLVDELSTLLGNPPART